MRFAILAVSCLRGGSLDYDNGRMFIGNPIGEVPVDCAREVGRGTARTVEREAGVYGLISFIVKHLVHLKT